MVNFLSEFIPSYKTLNRNDSHIECVNHWNIIKNTVLKHIKGHFIIMSKTIIQSSSALIKEGNDEKAQISLSIFETV